MPLGVAQPSLFCYGNRARFFLFQGRKLCVPLRVNEVTMVLSANLVYQIADMEFTYLESILQYMSS